MLEKKLFFDKFTIGLPGKVSQMIPELHEGVGIYFEKLSMAGLQEMHRYSTNPKLYEYLEFDPFQTIDQTEKYIAKLEARMSADPEQPRSAYWFVRRKLDGYLIGTAGLTSLDYDRQSIEWGYGVDPDLWGFGYILQIQELLKYFVFEELELNRLHGITMVTNQRTISSLLASGMKQEGIARQHYCKANNFVDGWQYAMLRSDYLETKKERNSNNKKFSIGELVSLVTEILPSEKINIDSTMLNTPSWDSLNHMTIMIAVTEKAGVILRPSEIMRSNSIKTLFQIISEKRLDK